MRILASADLHGVERVSEWLLGEARRHPFLLHGHGHSHGGFGRAGRHVNVASGGRARAMILDLATGPIRS